MIPYIFRGVTLPDNLQESLDAYNNDGRPTGDFLQACIENDLIGAFGRADEVSIAALPAIVGYLYNELDSRCWGHQGAFQEWIDRKRMERVA